MYLYKRLVKKSAHHWIQIQSIYSYCVELCQIARNLLELRHLSIKMCENLEQIIVINIKTHCIIISNRHAFQISRKFLSILQQIRVFSCYCSSKSVAIEGTDRWILFKFGAYLCLWWWRGSNIIEARIISNLHALQISLKLLLRGCHKLKSLIRVNIARNLRQLKYLHIKWR